MLIVPVEKGLDWSRAPVVTAALVILNCLVYGLWQTGDDEKLAQAMARYQQSSLPAIEFPVYISHLHQSRQSKLATRLEAAWQANERELVYAHLLLDRSFSAFLEKTTMDFWGEDVFSQWQQDRAAIEQQIQQISAVKLGLIPANDRGITYVTYQFLHADVWHLLSNMLFLIIVGMGVEAAIGSFFFAIGYLVCGILAGLFYSVVASGSYVPLVGASGSVSALMGMYAVIYGLRKIRFFYFVIFYFGFITLPALAVLPVWLVIEVLQEVFNTESYIAYWAHAGGLVAGAGLLAATRKWALQVEEEYYETVDEDEDYRKDLNRLMNQIGQFSFDSAHKTVTELLQKYPEDIPLITQHYHISKLHGDPAKTQRLLERLLDKYSHLPRREKVVEALMLDFMNRYPDNTLSTDIRLKLIIYLIQGDTMTTAEQLLRSLLNDKVNDPRLLKAIRTFMRYYQEKNDKKSLYRYQQLAEAVEKQLPAS
ncbi:MAG: rhomboid family intramembrane serine protease [Ketobacteraceae bacterium]|nr:rhomboid family intramembrane serine protease [Ketobacteraceae bacterium]